MVLRALLRIAGHSLRRGVPVQLSAGRWLLGPFGHHRAGGEVKNSSEAFW